MGGLTPGHLIIVLIVVMIVVGPGKLPELGSALGKSIREFQKATGPMKDLIDPAKMLGMGAAQPTQASQPQPAAMTQPGFVGQPMGAPDAMVMPQQVPPMYAPQQMAPIYAPQPGGYLPPQPGGYLPPQPGGYLPPQAYPAVAPSMPVPAVADPAPAAGDTAH